MFFAEIIEMLQNHLLTADIKEFDSDSLKKFLRNFATSNKVPFPELMKSLPSVLSGLKVKHFFFFINLILVII